LITGHLTRTATPLSTSTIPRRNPFFRPNILWWYEMKYTAFQFVSVGAIIRFRRQYDFRGVPNPGELVRAIRLPQQFDRVNIFSAYLSFDSVGLFSQRQRRIQEKDEFDGQDELHFSWTLIMKSRKLKVGLWLASSE
jgi:hypothetical protein